MVKQSELRKANPWWKSKEKIDQDKQFREWTNSMIRLDPRLRHKINFNDPSDVIYTIRGPRQVGKTTLIKLQIHDFLYHEVPPWDILYYALDLVNNPQEIVDVVETFQKLTRTRRKGRCYIFLDEVTSVPNWQKAIKSLVDANKLKNCTVVATGSQALNIKKDTERLPGRRGTPSDNYDKILLPMKFAEYVEVTDSEINNLVQSTQLRLFANRKNAFDELINLQIPKSIERLNDYQNELDDHLHDYLMTGGTPKVVDSVVQLKEIPESIYGSYLEGILGDWALEGKNETLLRQLMTELIPSISSLVSWYKIKRDAEMGSENTVLDYVDTLKRLFIISTFYKYDVKKKVPNIRDQKKIHFEDPFYLHLFNAWTGPHRFFEASEKYLESKENESKLVEGVIGTHLIRWAFLLSRKKQIYEPSNHVFYWRDDKKKEVDYILYDGGKVEVPFEVKYRTTPKGLGGLYSFLSTTGKKSGIVISKDELDVKDNYVSIPASVFLMLI